MTLKIDQAWNCSSSSYSGQSSRKNSASAVALRRYLDLTLRGTRQSLTEAAARGQRNQPVLDHSSGSQKPVLSEGGTYCSGKLHPSSLSDDTKPPNWVNEMNARIVNHGGEAPIFSQNFLSYYKDEQSLSSPHHRQRPLSGISTKSAPVVINGAMYHRPNKAHSYLQASRRPASAVLNRMTRAAYLRKNHQSKARTGNPSDNTKEELQRMKGAKPMHHGLTKDLMPIPCHANETPHSFIIGARYNCSNFMDSRSFSRLGLYVPRSNPLGTFLKVYKGDESTYDNLNEQEHNEKTSVRTGGSMKRKGSTRPLSECNGRATYSKASHPGLPVPHIRKVFKESWLTETEGSKLPTSRPGSRSPVPPHPSPKPRPPSYNLKSAIKAGRESLNPRNAPMSSTPAFAKDPRLREAVVAAENTIFNGRRIGPNGRGVLEVE